MLWEVTGEDRNYQLIGTEKEDSEKIEREKHQSMIGFSLEGKHLRNLMVNLSWFYFPECIKRDGETGKGEKVIVSVDESKV